MSDRSESKLPDSWRWVEVREVAETITGNTPPTSDASSYGGEIPFIKPPQLVDGSISSAPESLSDAGATKARVLPIGAVLVSCIGNLGKTAITKVPCATNQQINALVFQPQVQPEFGFYYAQTLEPWLASVSSATTVSIVNKGKFETAPFPLAPLAEQTRIVAKLEELLSDLDAGVAELKAAQRKLMQYRQSLLKAAVEGALTAEWRKQRNASDVPLPPRGGGARGEGAQPTPTQEWLNERARQLRAEQTPHEHLLWQQLRANRFSGFKFKRQQVIGSYIVDFVCFGKRLIVELDGSQHADSKNDAGRDAWLNAQGFRVLRFWNNHVQSQLDAVLESIWNALHVQSPPLPNPSPARGEGLESETGAQLLDRILKQRRARWEARQLARFTEQGKVPPKDWQAKYPEPVKPDTTDLPSLPEGWVWASLDMLGEIASGVAKGSKQSPNAKLTEVAYLRVANVQRGFLDLDEIKTILATDADINELALQYGDVLFNEGGDRDKLGRGWVWRNEVPNCIHQNHVFRMRPLLPDVLPELISHHGNTFGKRWFQTAGKQTTNLASINMTMLRSFPVPLAPAHEQRVILERLENQVELLDRQQQAVGIGLKQAAAQRKNILKAAFSGQLVPQDPNDEPASVLLERIRAERNQVPSKKRAQRNRL